MRVWEDLLSDTDREMLKRKTLGHTGGLGDSPALAIVDMQYRFLGDNKPILEQLDEWPQGCGEMGYRALKNIKKLIDVARQTNIPIIYTTGQYIADNRFVTFRKGVKEDPVKEARGIQIAADIAPRPQDIIVSKRSPSAFFATPLIIYLTRLRIDTLIVTGCSTSGCVRAFVVDAMSYLFYVAVVEDCVFDRFSLSHAAALFDMWSKYCDVIKLQEAIDYIKVQG